MLGEGTSHPLMRLELNAPDLLAVPGGVVSGWVAALSDSGRSREQVERLDVCGAQNREVSMIERGELALAHTLDEREHTRIHHTQRLVVVMALKLVTACEVGTGAGLEPVSAGEQVLQERDPRVSAETGMAPIVELGQHEDGNDQILASFTEQRGAALVVGVGCVQGC